MTATTDRRHRRGIHLASMEVLGFFDSPRTTTVVPRSAMGGVVVHRPAAATGRLVEDLWNSSQVQENSLLDRSPEPIESGRLLKRNFRWSVVLVMLVALGGVAAAGLWAYQEPVRANQSALATLRDRARALQAVIGDIGEVADRLDGSADIEPTSDSALVDVDETARDLFTASASLPDSAAGEKALSADAAGLTLEVSQRVEEALAYQLALESALVVPQLDTDPDLVDLATASDVFSGWQTRLAAVGSTLPRDVAPPVSDALGDLLGDLETIQGDYLDALRTDDATASVSVLNGLQDRIDSIQGLLETEMGKVQDGVEDDLSTISDQLGRLLG